MKTNIKIGHYVTITCSTTNEQHPFPNGNIHVTIYYSKTDFNISFRYKGKLSFDNLFWFMVGTQIENQKNVLQNKIKYYDENCVLYRKHLQSVNTIFIAFQNYFNS